MENLEIVTFEDVTERRNHYVGVTKLRNRWQARVRHPLLKFEIYVGQYSSAEEAAAAVNKKKAEFEENCMSMETIGDEFVGINLPYGVSRRGYSRWGARIWQPELRRDVSLGSYMSPKEAAFIVCKTIEQFRKMYGERLRCGRSYEGVEDDALEEPECDYESASECFDEKTGVIKVLNGMRKCKSGEWVAVTGDPKSKARTWIGSFSIVEEAIDAYNKTVIMLAVERGREIKMLECRNKVRLDLEAVNAEEEVECESGYSCITSPLGIENSDYRVADDQLKCKEIVLHCGSAHRSPTSESYALDSNGVDACMERSDCQQSSICASNFDEAVNSGFINEYGQLLGEYSMLDEQMGLSLAADDVSDFYC